ncbi:MAG: alpha amylase C-terminal domain-containing protein, partial [Bosea sp. (in: a-proteobacteria)]
MGGEIAQEREWNHDGEIDWDLLKNPRHSGVQALVGDLNRIYRDLPALHASDASAADFRWLIKDDSDNSVFAYLRSRAGHEPVLVVVNMTPVPRHGYRIGVPQAGLWREILNSDAAHYGGSGVGNGGGAHAHAGHAGQDAVLELILPPLGALVFSFEGG